MLPSPGLGVLTRYLADRVRIVHAVDSFTAGEPPFDDMTLIVLKRDGAPNGNASPR